MRILERSVYVGPSLHAHFPVIRLLMDLDFEGATMHQEAAIVWAG